MLTELIFIKILETLAVVLAVVGELIYSKLHGIGSWVTEVDKGDSVLEWKVVDITYEVRCIWVFNHVNLLGFGYRNSLYFRECDKSQFKI